jgi:hypothetical protein
MKYSELILSCIECHRAFNPSIEGPDSHADKFLAKQSKDTHERMFIKQIFYGLLRYTEFLKVFTDNLFNMNKHSTERKDEVLYHIFTYVTIFRLDELPLEDYKSLVYVRSYINDLVTRYGQDERIL